MKTAALLICCFVTLSLIVVGCSDSSQGILTESQLASTTLASLNTVEILAPELTKENVKEYSLKKSKEGWDGISVVFSEGKVPVVKLQKKVQWDGKSPIEPGVIYEISNAQIMDAQLITDNFYRSLAGQEPSSAEKVKVSDDTQLATGCWYADPGWGQTGRWSAQGYADVGNPSGVGDIVIHRYQSQIWDNSGPWTYSEEVFYECETVEYTYFSHYYTANPADSVTNFSGIASAWDYDIRMAYDAAVFQIFN